MMDDEEALNFWKKNLLLNYIKPMYEQSVIAAITTIQEYMATEFQPNHEDGTFVYSDVKAEDFLPLTPKE